LTAETLIINQAAVDARKPSAKPLVHYSEAIAIALTVAEWKPGGLVDPEGIIVKAVMQAIDRAGWKIEPR
jgi:hypothetical protein